MSQNIYNIESWNPSIDYSPFDIYLYNNSYYYVVSAHSNINPELALTEGIVDGVGLDRFGRSKPRFFWAPSYSSSVNFNPKIKSVQFGDGYEVRSDDGINNILLDFDLNFENRSLAEYTAIMHFLTSRKGNQSFLYTPMPPFNQQKFFTCKTWNGRPNFYNNYSVTCKLVEVTN